jgi:hypothetical protein
MQKRKRQSGRRANVSRLDDAISNTAYVLDCLWTLRRILDSGCCNECVRINQKCSYAPDQGQMVRYNCPFFEKKEGEAQK